MRGVFELRHFGRLVLNMKKPRTRNKPEVSKVLEDLDELLQSDADVGDTPGLH